MKYWVYVAIVLYAWSLIGLIYVSDTCDLTQIMLAFGWVLLASFYIIDDNCEGWNKCWLVCFGVYFTVFSLFGILVTVCMWGVN